MAVSHHLRPGKTNKSKVRIMTVDTSTRRVEGVLQDGSMAHIAVWDTPNAFRWPKEGEIWVIWKQNGYWMLESRVEQSSVEPAPVTDMDPGDMKLDSAKVIDTNGDQMATHPWVESQLLNLGAAPITVTGAKGGNAALASLITALAQLGLVIDHTT